MFSSQYSDYSISRRFQSRSRAKDLLMDSPRAYANVILDVPARELRDKLFSYLIPQDLAGDTFAGTQVLVPFGATGQATGYVVSLATNPPRGISPKPILEVLDSDPLFEPEYVAFLNWVADYYGATLSDVVSAAVPSFLTPKIKRRVRIVPGIDPRKLEGFGDDDVEVMADVLKEVKGDSLSVLTLRQRWRRKTKGTQARFYKALSLLTDMRLIEKLPEKTAVQSPKTAKFVIWTGTESTDKRHDQIVKALVKNGGQMSLSELVSSVGTSSATLKRMSEKGLVVFKDEEQERNPLAHLVESFDVAPHTPQVKLTEFQEKAWTVLKENLLSTLAGSITETPVEPWLLYGVTGSGKTEIYLRLIEETLKANRTALLLVPEISLTPQLARRLIERFGNKVAIWHSALSQGERYDTWRRLRSGQGQVLLGARSAVLVNLPHLGLIIMDEEHESSYKQSTPAPRYHAKDVAIKKATINGALLLLGSATPDIATYQKAQQADRILSLPHRIFNQPMPESVLVDMREEFLNGNRSIFSQLLIQGLADCLANSEQAILLMNRRGFASHVFCRACGYVVTCKNCSVAMVYHQKSAIKNPGRPTEPEGFLACHHCGYQLGNPKECPSCRSQFIKQYGLGTQRVEVELRSRFPDARILRLDSDITTKKDAHEKILTDFSDGGADFLIGTQMVAKGLDIERVTLVGVLAADAGFNMPDYRSTERGFQLLTQVAGRAGRGKRPGKVILQTYNADMPTILWAQAHDYASFYAAEIEARQAYNYPPFSQLLRIVVAAEDAEQAERECDLIVEELGNYLEDSRDLSQIEILGPAPCLLERLRNKYRVHLIIKNREGEAGRKAIIEFFRNRKSESGAFVALDVDALDLI